MFIKVTASDLVVETGGLKAVTEFSHPLMVLSHRKIEWPFMKINRCLEPFLHHLTQYAMPNFYQGTACLTPWLYSPTYKLCKESALVMGWKWGWAGGVLNEKKDSISPRLPGAPSFLSPGAELQGWAVKRLQHPPFPGFSKLQMGCKMWIWKQICKFSHSNLPVYSQHQYCTCTA